MNNSQWPKMTQEQERAVAQNFRVFGGQHHFAQLPNYSTVYSPNQYDFSHMQFGHALNSGLYPYQQQPQPPPPPSYPYPGMMINHSVIQANQFLPAPPSTYIQGGNYSQFGQYPSSSSSNNYQNYQHPPPKLVTTKFEEKCYCESCDKEFVSQRDYKIHCGTHESCTVPGCTFSGSKKVVNAHFHATHGQFSGSGYKIIDVEGQKFRVLMGTNPDEVQQWRNDRKSRFPTRENIQIKSEHEEAFKNAGGVENNKRKRDRNSNSNKNSMRNNHDNDKNNNKKVKVELEEGEEGEIGDEVNAITSDDPQTVNNLEDKQQKDNNNDNNINNKQPLCRNFSRGKCQAGDQCPRSHDFTPKVCEYFTRNGRCRKGHQCLHIHDRNLHKLSKQQKQHHQGEGESVNIDKNDDDGVLLSNNGSDRQQTNNTDNQSTPTKSNNNSNNNNNASSNKKSKSLTNEKKKSGLIIPPPLDGGVRGTLLKKLLETEITKEENLILQCIRYIVQNQYFETCVEDEKLKNDDDTNSKGEEDGTESSSIDGDDNDSNDYDDNGNNAFEVIEKVLENNTISELI